LLLEKATPTVAPFAICKKDQPPANRPDSAKVTTEPGIVVHWNQNFKPGEDMVHYLNTAR
jgi:hypothetical protein